MPGSTFAEFCAAGLWPGLGATLAAELPAAGITAPEQVSSERLRALPKVGAIRAERLLSAWIGAQTVYEVAELLVPVGIGAKVAARAVDTLGDGAAGLLREDPWQLLALAEVTVTHADRLAVAVLPGVRRDDPRRGRALVRRVLVTAARDGHTAVPAERVRTDLAELGVADPAAAVAAAVDSGAVLAVAEELLALERYAMAETAIAESVARLVATATPIRTTPQRGRGGNGSGGNGGGNGAPAPRAGDAAGTDGGAGPDGAGSDETQPPAGELDPVQLGAVTAALRHGVSVLTGGPGTGKSRTVAALVAAAERHGKVVALAAPTGRAAKRLEELTDAGASTIHRLLGAMGTTGGFRHDESDPLEADVVVIDEVSMLDAELAAALLEACADGTHLLLVGDPAQLPSIGAGRVLADLVESGVVPVTELTTLYRQAEGGAIARLAAGVRTGALPVPDPGDREVVVVPAAGSAQAAHRVTQLVTDSIPRAVGIDAEQVQVVTPVHRGPAGTIELNRALKKLLNPGPGAVSGFDPGDRVVAVANHLDAEPVGFANGEIGVVLRTGHRSVTVEFASGTAEVSDKALVDLRHGWAVTVHRAQGSEWPAVVAVLPPEAGRMLSRPLIYTALTRARRHLSVVHAVGAALPRAVREVGAQPRRSRLRQLLAEECRAAEPVR